MRVKLLREGARAPSRAHPSDAGYDLYYCGTPREIWPHTVQVLGCGIAVDFDTADPDGSLRCGLVRDRSSVASRGLIVVGGVIDAGYRGELKVCLLNTSDRMLTVNHGEKIAQLIVVEVARDPVTVVDSLSPGDRGSAGFGSSGR